MNVLIWFRNDLRVADHPALARAADDRVLPLAIVDPAEWADPARSGRQWAFRAECLADLRADLAALGAPLAVRVGDAQAVLSKLCKLHRIGRILCLEDPAFAELDLALQAWAGGTGLDFIRLKPAPGARGADPAARGRTRADPACPRPAAGRGPLPPPPAGRASAGAAPAPEFP